MATGRVYWITGLSNSGKTTIGTTLYYTLKANGTNVVILDGDLMKLIASGSKTVEYGLEDRITRARRYAQMAKMLADQGQWVIVCVIAMSDEVRAWNREHIKGYIEVFLDTPDEVLKSRDRKGLYQKAENVEFPKNPDIIFKNDGEQPVREIVQEILKLSPANEEDYDRDREYWNDYYQKIKQQKVVPSNFAVETEKRLAKGSHILELGCGNGRDSLYFLDKGHNVIAIDGSDTAIEMLNELTEDNKDALFVCDNFVKCQSLYQMPYDCIYSRFTLHAITEEQENELLGNIKGALCKDGLLCIEARTIHDEIYGMGEEVAHNAYLYNGHFRRFINVDEFSDKLKSLGFEIVELIESNGFSKTETSDPVLMRCIAKLGTRE